MKLKFKILVVRGMKDFSFLCYFTMCSLLVILHDIGLIEYCVAIKNLKSKQTQKNITSITKKSYFSY